MWRQNLLLVVCVGGGVAVLTALLWPPASIPAPQNYDPGRWARPEYAEVVGKLNREFREASRRQGFEPAPRASDLTIVRRLSLGLTGTIPSLEEIRALESVPADSRVEWWVSRLMEDQRTSDYLGERLARVFVGTDQGPFLLFRRRRFVTWLSEQVRANRPYDAVVREMITAHGLWTDTPAVNFLTATAGGNAGNQPDDIKLAGRTARAFLACRLDCLQCHDDKLGTIALGTPEEPREGEQRDFHQLAAFFSDAHTSLLGIQDFRADYSYQFLGQAEKEVVAPVPPFQVDLVSAHGTRRQQLARWVTHPENRAFARAIVNRLWALMTGKPLVEPVDRIPLNGPFPPGLETLADDFTQRGCDLQRTIRLIAATEAFQRDSRADFVVTPDHEAAWAVFPLTRLRPEQVAGSLLQAASLSTIDAHAHILSQLARFFQERDFVARFGDLGEDEFSTQPSTITQRLLLMNGKLVRERTRDNLISNAATRIALLAPGDQQAVEAAYLAVLTRRPTATESRSFAAILSGVTRPDGAEPLGRRQALEDLYWVLINSSEFAWNH